MITKGEILPSCEFAEIEAVHNVNHRPHRFTIGPKHVVYASEHCSGMLGEEVCKKVPCAHPGCTTRYEDHTSDRVAFVRLRRDVRNKELGKWLMSIVEDGWTADARVDGFTFIEGFKVLSDEEE